MSKYRNMPACDLRHLNDVNAVRQIEEISNIALLILPKDAPEEVMSAITAIPKSNIASTIYLDKDDNVQVINGMHEATDSDFASDGKTVMIVNGLMLAKDISRETKGAVAVNGVVILHENLRSGCSLTFPMVNGARLFIDYQDYKAAPNDIEIDSEFISYLAPKTLVMAGSSITVEKDVTPEILREKEVKLFAGDCINCYKHVASYIKAHAYVRNKVNVLPDDNNG